MTHKPAQADCLMVLPSGQQLRVQPAMNTMALRIFDQWTAINRSLVRAALAEYRNAQKDTVLLGDFYLMFGQTERVERARRNLILAWHDMRATQRLRADWVREWKSRLRR
jgi:hypothetical protein